jgi:hypothetical protein
MPQSSTRNRPLTGARERTREALEIFSEAYGVNDDLAVRVVAYYLMPSHQASAALARRAPGERVNYGGAYA